MMTVLKKTYTISVQVQEDEDEFWHELRNQNGADIVTREIEDCIKSRGFRCNVILDKFEWKAPMVLL